jgi:hypothetical protein
MEPAFCFLSEIFWKVLDKRQTKNMKKLLILLSFVVLALQKPLSDDCRNCLYLGDAAKLQLNRHGVIFEEIVGNVSVLCQKPRYLKTVIWSFSTHFSSAK